LCIEECKKYRHLKYVKTGVDKQRLEKFQRVFLRTQAQERIERYFEDYKTQINNSLAGMV